MKKYIRSSKTALKFTNKGKLNLLDSIISEYTNVVNEFIKILWTNDINKIPKFLDKDTTNQVSTWLSARMVQCAGKQASGIVRGVVSKQRKRLYIYEKLISERKYKKARKLKKIIDSKNLSVPTVDTVPMQLDSRFVKIDMDNETSFDGWITLSSVGDKIKIKLPFKRTKHFNKYYQRGKLLSNVRITKDCLEFSFEVQKEEPKSEGKTIGIDIGSSNVISCSDGQQSNPGLGDIQKKIARKKKGSKAYQRAIKERENYINWSINQLNLEGVKEVKRENIKNLKKGKRTSKFLTAWTYTDIFDKLDRYCEEQNVSVTKVAPTYTSQRCSCCGWTQKTNRKGKEFKCKQCGNTLDADLNASLNISLSLKPIGKQERLLQKNRKGFYWLEEGQEHIVPDTSKNLKEEYFSIL